MGKKMRKPCFWLACAALLLPAPARAQWKTPWEYVGPRGPAHWSELDPAYDACAGKMQSPIDIRHAHKADLPALQFDYKTGPLKYLINNGKTIRVNYHDAPGTGNVLIVDGDTYHLTQFHFHHPGEETINGKTYEMVAHLMHQSTDGKLAGVAVFLKSGHANPTLQRIWDHMPLTEGEEQEIPGVEIDPAGLLPSDRSYYTYEGSLTAPPCTEGVTWFVLKVPLEVSREQIEAFARLYPKDVRPVQPRNGRMIKQSR
jgi:carbonic anhydrase